MALYVGLYFVCMLVGLLVSVVLDVQLRRPGVRQAIGLVIFAFLIWGALSITFQPLTDFLLPLIWAGTGLLAGLGSRGHHAPG